MERVYNKLNRLTIADFKQLLTDLNISHSRCKTKNDYIRVFLKKKAKSVKLTPKKMMKNRAKISKEIRDCDESSISSYYSKCIIEEMEDKDVNKVEHFIKTVKTSKSKSPKLGKRRRSTPKKTKNKAVKQHEKQEVVSSFNALPSPKATKSKNKRHQKKIKEKPKSSKRMVTRLASSVNSTPRRLDPSPDPPKNEYPKASYRGAIVSEISDAVHESEEDPPSFSNDNPEHFIQNRVRKRNGRSTMGEMHEGTHPKVIMKLPTEDIEAHDDRRTPLKRFIDAQQRIMTPVKNFASKVQRRVESSYLIKSEWFGTIFLICIVSAFMLAGAINFASKVPFENYKLPGNHTIKYMEWNPIDEIYDCQQGTVSVGHLCADENDQAYIDEVLAMSGVFDELIQRYDKCVGTLKDITVPVSNPAIIKEIAINPYYRSRIEFKQLEVYKFTFSLKEDFNVIPTLLSRIKCSLSNMSASGNGMKIFLIFLFLLVIAISAYKVGQLLQENDTRIAKKIFKSVLKEMQESGLHRNGLNPDKIYFWYSSQTSLTKEEFDERVLPLIEVYFHESDLIRSTTNRTGVQVWKLVE
ncbi:unnamed protein product [Moneuplotes crassus]|uniref:LEM domain-containing protein n=1 Tax=Euplotes crassus TaxID=5936 RepID=A0AAD1X6V3_EUPCR|nr:unnamed protein product [Moneuplotes crassus]